MENQNILKIITPELDRCVLKTRHLDYTLNYEYDFIAAVLSTEYGDWRNRRMKVSENVGFFPHSDREKDWFIDLCQICIKIGYDHGICFTDFPWEYSEMDAEEYLIKYLTEYKQQGFYIMDQTVNEIILCPKIRISGTNSSQCTVLIQQDDRTYFFNFIGNKLSSFGDKEAEVIFQCEPRRGLPNLERATEIYLKTKKPTRLHELRISANNERIKQQKLRGYSFDHKDTLKEFFNHSALVMPIVELRKEYTGMVLRQEYDSAVELRSKERELIDQLIAVNGYKFRDGNYFIETEDYVFSHLLYGMF